MLMKRPSNPICLPVNYWNNQYYSGQVSAHFFSKYCSRLHLKQKQAESSSAPETPILVQFRLPSQLFSEGEAKSIQELNPSKEAWLYGMPGTWEFSNGRYI